MKDKKFSSVDHIFRQRAIWSPVKTYHFWGKTSMIEGIKSNGMIRMKERIPLSMKFITGFSILGFLFSGYLSVIKLLSGACAIRESCPYFLGFPVCFYGFGMYLALIVLAAFILRKRMDIHRGVIGIAAVAFLGILFSGYFSIIELPSLIRNGFAAHTFGVPTCMLGLVMYMLIFATAVLGLAHEER